MTQKVVVIGGGIGGLTAAALLAKEKMDVTLLEASNEWGGCAGKFTRGEYLFPVGATLGMGFEKGGIHRRIFDELDLSFEEIHLLDIIMDIHLPGKTVRYYHNRSSYLRELKSHFPHLNSRIHSFYEDIWKIGAEVKKLIEPLPVLPPKTAGEWGKLLKSIKLTSLRLLPYFQQTLCAILTKHNLSEEHEFSHIIDAQLIDSMQTTSRECSAILGAYALSVYHEGAFYVNGGLFQIAHRLAASIENNGGELLKRSFAKEIRRENDAYVITDHRGRTFTAKQIICNLPLLSFTNLLSQELRHSLSRAYLKKLEQPQWGTMTLYLAVKEELIPDNFPLFHQVIDNHSGEMAEGHHIFLSLSKKNDLLRAPNGYRTITSSTHTELKHWNTKEKYDRYKQQLTEKMLHSIEMALPNLQEGLVEMVAGAPKAWERFTKRPDGIVGGYPQTLNNALFRSLSHRTGINGIYLCGDSVFPGAGTIGVSVSGYHAYQSVKWKRSQANA
jgi:C-3',4' desaturase CrtD